MSSASVTVTLADMNKGSDTTSCTQDYSRSLDDDGTKDCDAGHILANRLGGPGNQPINIFPQVLKFNFISLIYLNISKDLHVNRGSYNQFEGEIYDCIQGGASSAYLSWTFTYASTTNTKPISLMYSAAFSGGSCADKYSEFSNLN